MSNTSILKIYTDTPQNAKADTRLIKCSQFYTEWGDCFVAKHTNGYCDLFFYETKKEYDIFYKMFLEKWANAKLDWTKNELYSEMQLWFNQHIFSGSLHLIGTEFQVLVWTKLLIIPFGATSNYQQIAIQLNKPKASRAVGSAVGKNSIAGIVPCHRVINKNGEIGNYRWGKELKTKMLDFESKSKYQ